MLNEVSSRNGQEIAENPAAPYRMSGKNWLKNGLTMAICCTTPLLVVGTIAFFGLSVGALASEAFSLMALLACPVAMLLMVRMMTKEEK